jgi:hypothetical protein
MDPDPWGSVAADFQRFTYGPVFRYFRKRNLRLKYDNEPDWRAPGKTLTSGHPPGGPPSTDRARRW